MSYLWDAFYISVYMYYITADNSIKLYFTLYLKLLISYLSFHLDSALFPRYAAFYRMNNILLNDYIKRFLLLIPKIKHSHFLTVLCYSYILNYYCFVDDSLKVFSRFAITSNSDISPYVCYLSYMLLICHCI